MARNGPARRSKDAVDRRQSALHVAGAAGARRQAPAAPLSCAAATLQCKENSEATQQLPCTLAAGLKEKKIRLGPRGATEEVGGCERRQCCNTKLHGEASAELCRLAVRDGGGTLCPVCRVSCGRGGTGSRSGRGWRRPSLLVACGCLRGPPSLWVFVGDVLGGSTQRSGDMSGPSGRPAAAHAGLPPPLRLVQLSSTTRPLCPPALRVRCRMECPSHSSLGDCAASSRGSLCLLGSLVCLIGAHLSRVGGLLRRAHLLRCARLLLRKRAAATLCTSL